MSILENTISMMEVLPEADLLEIQNFTKKLFRLRNVNSCFQPVSEEKILYDKELQDSYGVMTPEDLAFAMVDDPGEYNDFCEWLQKFQGFTKTLDEKVDEAKN